MRSYVRSGIVALILASMGFAMGIASAQAVPKVATPGYTARLSAAIEGIVGARLARWGIAANDPRYSATIKGISGGLTVLAGVGLAGGTAISWPALLVAAGISGVVIGGLNLAANKNFKWTFGADGSIVASGTVPGSYYVAPSSNTSSITAGQTVYWAFTSDKDGNANGRIYGVDPVQVVTTSFVSSGRSTVSSATCTGIYCRVVSGGGNVVNTTLNQGDAPSSSSTGYIDTRTAPPPVTIPATTYSTASAASAAIPASLNNEALSSEAIAAVVNAAWKSAEPASSSGGLPWSASDPISANEVEQWSSSNPTSNVSVSDFTSPANSVSGSPGISIGGSAPSVGGGGSSGTAPSTGGNTGSNGNTGTDTSAEPASPSAPVTDGKGEEINWGPNPNVGAPKLEDTPTAAKILDPIFSLMPDLKSFAVPAHAGVCPTAKFDLYKQSYSVDAHCKLMEDNRAVIAAVMTLCFTLASLFIVLRA